MSFFGRFPNAPPPSLDTKSSDLHPINRTADETNDESSFYPNSTFDTTSEWNPNLNSTKLDLYVRVAGLVNPARFWVREIPLGREYESVKVKPNSPLAKVNKIKSPKKIKTF
jgi:hypothetical protein